MPQAIASGQYRLVILDEANLGPTLRLFPVEELLALVDARPDGVELVLTGRAPTAACWTGPTWSPKCRKSSTITAKACWPGRGSNNRD